jgi:hypothetical protein
MKKFIGYIGAYSFYYLGHWTSIIMGKSRFVFLYTAYSWLMNTSVNIQDWAGLDKPWKTNQNER